MNKIIELKDLTKIFDKRSTGGISKISFDIFSNEIISIIGPSGSGKSTLLNCLYGKIKDFHGKINFLNDIKISYIEQRTDLDPEISIFENLEQKILYIEDKEKRANKVRSILSTLNITNEIDKKPLEISGGQYQRAIIAQALITDPNLLLLDEAFSHLDSLLREEIINELFPILKNQNISSIWVTHQNEDALTYSDRVCILNYGRLLMIDSPYNIYTKPQTLFVAQFLKHNCFVAKKKKDSIEIKSTMLRNKTNNFMDIKENKDFLLIIPPTSITLVSHGEFDIEGTVISTNFMGHFFKILIESKEILITAYIIGEKLIKNKNYKFKINLDYCYLIKEV